VLLLMAEIFVIPGFGIAGISGIVLVLGSLVAALIGNVGFDFPTGAAVTSAISTLAVTLVLLVLLMFSLGRYLPQTERFGQLVLAPDLSSATGYTSADTDVSLVGQQGTALTPLRPSGAVNIDGNRVDVVTAGDFIDAGARVEVVRVRGSRVEVRTVVTSPPSETSAS
jgi:membrane-bound serine protease (ClpP class)